MKYKILTEKYLVSIICQYNLPIMKQLLYLKDDQLKDSLLFIGYRETFSDSKSVLNNVNWPCHQKVIHLLSMYEGISISDLLKAITKQSLMILRDIIKLDIIIFQEE